MKTMNYHFGNFTFKCHFKPVGQGWEIGVHMNKKVVFVGNFIHRAEAGKWWTCMNTEMRNFTKTYWIANNTASGWYSNFMSNHLYKCYYKFLDGIFSKYNRSYNTAFTRDVKKYRTLRKGWSPTRRFQLIKAA